LNPKSEASEESKRDLSLRASRWLPIVADFREAARESGQERRSVSLSMDRREGSFKIFGGEAEEESGTKEGNSEATRSSKISQTNGDLITPRR